MTEGQVVAALEDGIRQVMAQGRTPCPPLSSGTKPIGDLPDFDSLIGVEVGVEVGGTTGWKMPDNPFVDDRGRSLTIKAAAQRIISENRGSRTAAGGAR